jgi:hypothetical protein
MKFHWIGSFAEKKFRWPRKFRRFWSFANPEVSLQNFKIWAKLLSFFKKAKIKIAISLWSIRDQQRNFSSEIWVSLQNLSVSL